MDAAKNPVVGVGGQDRTLSRTDAGVRDLVVLAIIAAGLIFVYAPTLMWLFDRWTRSVWSNVHGALVIPVLGYLAWSKLRRSVPLPPSASPIGFLLLGPALLLHAIDGGMHTQLLSAISMVLALPGLSLLFLGTERTRSILPLFPFLLFMLPIPLAVTEPIHLALRRIATLGSGSIVSALGIPVYTEGTTIHLARASLEVVNACSGFATLYASAAVAGVVAYLSRSPRRRLLVLVAAAPIAIGANIVRVALLSLLVVWWGSGILNTSLHTVSGIMTFALALPIITWVGRPEEAP